jgi:3-dehydroquinate synthase class II
MSFIGIVATNKDFENIKNVITKKLGSKVNAIKITENDVENIKNVKCETIVICKKISNFKEKQESLNQIIKNAKYLIINTDVEIDKDILKNIKINIITYGLNGKATITVSSIKEEEIILCLQRSIEDSNNSIVEPYEISIKIKEITNKKIYNFLASYAILTLYS